jgi:hypothetical protein
MNAEFRAAWEDVIARHADNLILDALQKSRQDIAEARIRDLIDDEHEDSIDGGACPMCGRDNRRSSNWRSDLFLWATVALMIAVGYALVQWSR